MTGLSAPIPKTSREVNDQFATIALSAPAFEFLNKHVTYTITLDMMMDTLRQGVQNVAKRSKRPDAQARYQECLDAIDVAHELYRENRIPDAKHATWAANQLFKDAGKASRS